jgi:hypothetical protein
MADRSLLRLSAALVVLGDLLVTVIVLFLHPGGGATEESVFTAFAASGDWVAIHLAQFAGMAAILTGLLVLSFALDLPAGAPRWVGFFGALSAGVALALASVVFAVDGVANKRAVDAWVSAPAAERAARFASAEALRWLEMGATSYQDVMTGLALVLVAIAVAWTARVPRPIGTLLGLAGVAYLAQGWLIGTTGFTPATTVPTDAGYTLLVAGMIWVLIVTWRPSLAGAHKRVDEEDSPARGRSAPVS